MRPIERDLQRFKQIVRGEVEKRVREFLTRTEYVGEVAGRPVSIPLPQLEVPRLIYGENAFGEGEGDGEGSGTGQGGMGGAGQGSLGPGGHIPVAEIEFDELLELMGEVLRLPRLEPKGPGAVEETSKRYTTLSRFGPESLRHVRRTLRQALRRSLISGDYRPDDPQLIPEPGDFRYRAPREHPRPIAQAVVVFALDVSGSMAGEQLEIVKQLAFWITAWIRKHFPSLDRRYILHDTEAWEVDEHAFFRVREGGGTRLSSAIQLAAKLLEEYPPDLYNRYVYHFSDGENWSEDTGQALETLEELLPTLALFGYGQVHLRHGQGRFLEDLVEYFGEDYEALAAAEIRGRNSLPEALRRLLGGDRDGS